MAVGDGVGAAGQAIVLNVLVQKLSEAKEGTFGWVCKADRRCSQGKDLSRSKTTGRIAGRSADQAWQVRRQ